MKYIQSTNDLNPGSFHAALSRCNPKMATMTYVTNANHKFVYTAVNALPAHSLARAIGVFSSFSSASSMYTISSNSCRFDRTPGSSSSRPRIASSRALALEVANVDPSSSTPTFVRLASSKSAPYVCSVRSLMLRVVRVPSRLASRASTPAPRSADWRRWMEFWCSEERPRLGQTAGRDSRNRPLISSRARMSHVRVRA